MNRILIMFLVLSGFAASGCKKDEPKPTNVSITVIGANGNLLSGFTVYSKTANRFAMTGTSSDLLDQTVFTDANGVAKFGFNRAQDFADGGSQQSYVFYCTYTLSGSPTVSRSKHIGVTINKGTESSATLILN